MAEGALDPIALAIEALVVADGDRPVRPRRDDCLNAPSFQIGPYGIGIIGFVGQQRLGFLLGQVDQVVIGLAVRRFSRREVEGDRSASGITETVNFTGEPAP